jgi:hypothetical protein
MGSPRTYSARTRFQPETAGLSDQFHNKARESAHQDAVTSSSPAN